MQKLIDQPLLFHYSQGYNMPANFDSVKSTNAYIDLAVIEKIDNQLSKDNKL